MEEMDFSSLFASIGYFDFFIVISCFLLFWALRNKNGQPIYFPFLGTFPSLIFNLHRFHEWVTEFLSRSTNGTFLLKGLWFTNTDLLTTSDPANVHYIMSTKFSNFPKGPLIKKILGALGDGIFTSDSDMWKNQRELARALIIHQRFHKCFVKTTCDKIENGLIPVLEFMAKEDKIVDLQDVFKRFTFDTTFKLVTGIDLGCLSSELPDVPFSKAMDDGQDAVFIRYLLPQSVWKLQQWLGVGPEKKLSNAVEVLDQILGNNISIQREKFMSKGARSQEEEEDFDLTSYIINGGEPTTDLKLANKFLRDTNINFMFAGRDGISACLTWFSWLLCKHPEVEKNIREALTAIIPKGEAEKPRLFTLDELKNVVYLHAALCECMRLYPPVPLQHKNPQGPDILPSGHHVHSNMRVMISLFAMGRMESIWGKDAIEFKPERWISERGTVKHVPSYKFFAFNAGPRTCVGKHVSFAQIKLVAAAVIHNYQIEMVKDHDVYPNSSIVLYMKHGFKVRVRKRWA